MKKKKLKSFFLLISFSCFAMNHTESYGNLVALAQGVDEQNLATIEEEDFKLEDESSVEKSEILKPYQYNEIEKSHWYHKIFKLNRSDLDEMKKILISHNFIRLGREGQAIYYPLHEAVRSGLVPVIELLIQLKADLNYSNYHGATPLHYVSRMIFNKKDKEKALAIAEYLLANGADPNVVNNIDDSALSLAVDAGFRRLVRLLHKYGAKVSDPDMYKINGSPLERAAKLANYKMVKVLLKRDAQEIDQAIRAVNDKLNYYNNKDQKLASDRRRVKKLNNCLLYLQNPKLVNLSLSEVKRRIRSKALSKG